MLFLKKSVRYRVTTGYKKTQNKMLRQTHSLAIKTDMTGNFQIEDLW